MSELKDSAIRWRIRLRDGTAEDWEEFARWLEGDPARSGAYDSIALLDQDLGGVKPRRAPIELQPITQRAAPGRWRGVLAAATAITAALLLTIWLMPWSRWQSTSYQVTTAAGERRGIALADGSQVVLNGSTRLILDRNRPRDAELVRGEAMFTIVHNADDPFSVKVGDDEIRDIGTAFNVIRDAVDLRIEVAEGAVLFNPEAEHVQLTAGQTLRVAPDGEAAIGRRIPAAVGSWRDGQLSYEMAPLGEVARDIARSTGVPIALAPSLAVQSFTGSVRIDGGGDEAARGLAATLGADARRLRGGWLIEPHGGSAR